MATKYPLTTYFLNFISEKIDGEDNLLFKDNKKNIYKYFGISQEDNTGFIYFSPSNLYYSYTSWDNFYNSLFQEITQNKIKYPAVPTILPKEDWKKNEVTITNTLNKIISNKQSQDKILEKYKTFKWIDKNLVKLLKKGNNLNETDLRLRGRLLLQEILPVQQYSGGSVYDLSHVEYIKAFFESKGTIRDSEYLLKYLGYNVDLGTAGEDIINVDIDWKTFNDSGLKALIHPKQKEEQKIVPANIDNLVENDIDYFLSKYKVDCNLYGNNNNQSMTQISNGLATNITKKDAESIYAEVAKSNPKNNSKSNSSTLNATPTKNDTQKTIQTDRQFPNIPLLSDLKIISRGYPNKNFYEFFNDKVVLTKEGIEWYNSGKNLPDYDIVVKEIKDASKDKNFVVDKDKKIVKYWLTKIEDRAELDTYEIIPEESKDTPYKVRIQLSENGKILFQKTGILEHYKIEKRNEPILQTALQNYDVILKIKNPGEIQYYKISQDGEITLNEVGAELVNKSKPLPPYEIYIEDNKTGLEKDFKETPLQVVQVNDSVKLRVTKVKEVIQGEAKENDLIGIAQAFDEDGDNISLSIKSVYPKISYTKDKNGNIEDIEFYKIDEKGNITLTKEGADAINKGYNLPNFVVFSTDGKQKEKTKFYAEYSPTALNLDVDVEKFQATEEKATDKTLIGKVLIKKHGFSSKTVGSDGKTELETDKYLKDASSVEVKDNSTGNTTENTSENNSSNDSSKTGNTTENTSGNSTGNNTSSSSKKDSNSVSGDSLFNKGDGTKKVNDKIIDLNFNIDVLNSSFKGLFTSDIQKLVQEVISKRNTANVKIGKINVKEPITEKYPDLTIELLTRLLHFLEKYDFKKEENLIYQKNISDCRRAFSRFERLVDNRCYFNLSNSSKNKVNNDLNGYEDMTMFETFLFTEKDKFKKQELLKKEFKKVQFDSYEVYRLVNNRVKKSIKNTNPIIITNTSLLDDKNYKYVIDKKIYDKCSNYFIKINNSSLEKINNLSFCKVRNRRIEDALTIAPFLRDMYLWKLNQDGMKDKEIREEKYNFFHKEENKNKFFDNVAVDLFSETRVDVYPYFSQRISNKSNDKIKNAKNYSRVLNNKGISEFLNSIRKVDEIVSFNFKENFNLNIVKKKVDFLLPSKLNNKAGYTINNKELRGVFNDDRIKENQTILQNVIQKEGTNLIKYFVSNKEIKRVGNVKERKVSNRNITLDRIKKITYSYDEKVKKDQKENINMSLFDDEIFIDKYKNNVIETIKDRKDVLSFTEHIFNDRINNLNYQVINNKDNKIVSVIENSVKNLLKELKENYNFKVSDDSSIKINRREIEEYFSILVRNDIDIKIDNKQNKRVKNVIRKVDENFYFNEHKSYRENLFDKKISNSNYTTVKNNEKRSLSNVPIRELIQKQRFYYEKDKYKFKEDDNKDISLTKYNNDIYPKYQWKYLVNGKSKFKINNKEAKKLNNLEVKSEGDLNYYVHIKRDDDKEFDWYFSEINEDNYNWYVYYDKKSNSSSNSNSGSGSK